MSKKNLSKFISEAEKEWGELLPKRVIGKEKKTVYVEEVRAKLFAFEKFKQLTKEIEEEVDIGEVNCQHGLMSCDCAKYNKAVSEQKKNFERYMKCQIKRKRKKN